MSSDPWERLILARLFGIATYGTHMTVYEDLPNKDGNRPHPDRICVARLVHSTAISGKCQSRDALSTVAIASVDAYEHEVVALLLL